MKNLLCLLSIIISPYLAASGIENNGNFTFQRTSLFAQNDITQAKEYLEDLNASCCKNKCERGPRGRRGKDGDPGPAGSASPGSIIPFASGNPINLSTVGPFNLATGAILGFGNNVTNNLTPTPIDLQNNSNLAFSMPRDGTITSIAAYFTFNFSDLPEASTETLTVQADIYTSTAPNNLFTLVPSTTVLLTPAYTSISALGDHADGILTGLNIAVTAKTRVLLVFSVTGTGDSRIFLNGYAGAGITIE